MKLQLFVREFLCPNIVIPKLCQNRVFLCFLTLLFTVFIIFIYSDPINPSNYHPIIQSIISLNLNKYGSYLSSNRRNANDVKRILLWTPFFRVPDYGFGTGRDAFVRAKCPVNNCMTTTDRNSLNQSDAVIFHPFDVNVKDLPRHRMAHQRYIFMFVEAHFSYRSYPVFRNPATNFEFFNWTMTYRRDSDVYDSRYGRILRRNQSDAPASLPLTLSSEESPPDPSSFWQLSQPPVGNRTKLVAWFVSNCNTPSKREIFFRRMANSVPIDIFGGCGSLKCKPSRSVKCDKLLDDYKFYIAAENSICPDYVTEKFYRALEVGVVPIVYGGADYSAYAPPHSYINAADFQSAQELADYLLLLDRNPRLYSKYLEWNKNWQVENRKGSGGWCRLCEKLNTNSDVKIYKDMAKWYYDKVPCLSGTSIMGNTKRRRHINLK